jgi:hypothetical protein
MKSAFCPVTALHGSAALPFVIPSEAEGSAVPRTIPGNVFRQSEAKWSLLFSSPATEANESTALPFVIPSVAEGSAVLSISNKSRGERPAPLCHPDRSEPGFPATLHRTRPRVRLSVEKGA